MERLTGALETVLPVVFALFLGWLLKRTRMISREGVTALKRVAMNVTLPAVLFSAFSTAQYGAETILIVAAMYLICVLALLLGRLGARALGVSSRFAPFLSTGYEAGMLGYALITLLRGASGASRFALIDLGQVLFVFTLYKALLSAMETGRTDFKSVGREIVSSSTVWAIAIGVLLGATGLGRALYAGAAGKIVSAVAGFVSAPTGFMILLTIGYDLDFRSIDYRAAGRTVLLRLGVSALMLLAMFLLLRTLGGGTVDPVMSLAAVVMFLLPPPYVLPILADDEGERAYVSSALSMLTLITILGFSVMALIV